jgi:transcriptional regulator GlxA family with amidase domain
MRRAGLPISKRRTIAVVAFEGISPFHLSVPCLVFGEDRSEVGMPPYEILVSSLERGPLRTSAGFRIEAPHGLGRLSEAGIVIVPSWRDPGERPPARLISALRSAHASGAKIVGLCLGAFPVAEAGLLDGRRATTHWRWASMFAARFPRVELDPGVLYVDEGDVLTSAGTAAAIDACLHLLRSDVGAEIANRVARRLIVSPHRRGGQAQFIEQPLGDDEADDRLSRTMEWALRRLDEPLGLDALAARAFMSRRNFTRRFREATGTTVHRWLLDQRVALAQRLLETTDQPVERVAMSAGFGTALSLRVRFAEAVGTSPSAYRRDFRGEAL